MAGPAPDGLFVYACDMERVAGFYQAVLGMTRLHASAEIVVLQSSHIQLLIHATPAPIAATIVITSPPELREQTALKFFFTVPNIGEARITARSLGGDVHAQQWNGPGFVVCNANDPEGNIFQVREKIAV